MGFPSCYALPFLSSFIFHLFILVSSNPIIFFYHVVIYIIPSLSTSHISYHLIIRVFSPFSYDPSLFHHFFLGLISCFLLTVTAWVAIWCQEYGI